jgi:hypothetical protein
MSGVNEFYGTDELTKNLIKIKKEVQVKYLNIEDEFEN